MDCYTQAETELFHARKRVGMVTVGINPIPPATNAMSELRLSSIYGHDYVTYPMMLWNFMNPFAIDIHVMTYVSVIYMSVV